MTKSESKATREAALKYFDAVASRDLDAIAACWAADGIDRLVGMQDLIGPAGVRAYFEDLLNAIPDFELEVITANADGASCTVRWRATGTFAGPGSFQGFEPTGASLEIEGCDVLTIEDGLVANNHAYLDGASIARQIGALPQSGSSAELRMTALANRRTRIGKWLAASPPEPVADGVWVIRGGFPSKTMNVYLIEDQGGITVFDAGIASMAKPIAAAGARMGGIKRVVLGHGHADHRGAAPALNVPIYCHPAERVDAEADGGEHYFKIDLLNPVGRMLMPKLLEHWDGGPCEIAGTVDEGDEVAGFKVIHLPGHAPGLIGLWRESDRLALVSDCFYTLNPETGAKGHARVPHSAFNQDTELARASILKLAALEPAAAWAGHADPLTGDVRSQLEHAAATT